ncbi:transglycosylase SLT domain-containing protein [Streptomyces sp. NPDC052000]|uniref:transglycosylase SLT domain-containing protein n=1 Tax=Streptomyces sp. NPDC052000 TaxID=3155676 RepID=UPI00344D42A4
MADPTLDQLLAGIRDQESGGSYTIVNSIGAMGAYQVMPENLASWTQEALGHTLTKAQFLASPADQDRVARYIIGGYYTKYGAQGAAAMWYSDQPDPTKTFGDPPVHEYVDDVIKKALKLTGSTSGSSGGAVNATPAGLLDIPGDVLNFFKTAVNDMTATANFLGAFFKPSTYVRIGSGLFGFVFIILGIYCLAREANNG